MRIPTAGVLCVLCSTACGEDAENHAGDEDPAEHACEQVTVPGTSVAAAADRAGAPEITVSDRPYDVTVVAGGPSFVRVEGELDALLFTRASGVVSGVYHDQGSANLLPAPSPNAACPNEIPEHFDLALDQSGSHYVELAPAATSSVWLMLTSAGSHGH